MPSGNQAGRRTQRAQDARELAIRDERPPDRQHLLLAARALGYGGALTMWHLGVEDELRELFSVPDSAVLSACITLGVPEGHHGVLKRKPLSELTYDDVWGATPNWLTL